MNRNQIQPGFEPGDYCPHYPSSSSGPSNGDGPFTGFQDVTSHFRVLAWFTESTDCRSLALSVLTVLGFECQQLATLLVVVSLLATGSEQLLVDLVTHLGTGNGGSCQFFIAFQFSAPYHLRCYKSQLLVTFDISDSGVTSLGSYPLWTRVAFAGTRS